MRRKKSDNDDKIDETVDSRKHGKDIKILELKCENLEKALLLNDNLMIAEQSKNIMSQNLTKLYFLLVFLLT